jgi:predicted RNA polymerase sigma factor
MKDDKRLAGYPFFWAALADIERRSGRKEDARSLYQRAAILARNRAERVAYERRIERLEE